MTFLYLIFLSDYNNRQTNEGGSQMSSLLRSLVIIAIGTY